MKTYREFHGETPITEIGKRLREIVRDEKKNFKILTGYGSTTIYSKSKQSAITSLIKMKKEGLIKAFFPGDVKYKILYQSDNYYDDKIKYGSLVKNDPDYGNEGIIFIFV